MKRLFGFLLLVTLLWSCATASNIARTCAPATTDETQAVTELWTRPDLTTLETVAILEGGKIAACVVSEIAKDVIARANTIKLSAQIGTQAPVIVERAQAWLAVHP